MNKLDKVIIPVLELYVWLIVYVLPPIILVAGFYGFYLTVISIRDRAKNPGSFSDMNRLFVTGGQTVGAIGFPFLIVLTIQEMYLYNI